MTMTTATTTPRQQHQQQQYQQQHPANLSHSIWDGPGSTQTPINTKGLLPNPPALSALQNQVSETDIKIFIQSVVTISTALSEGTENPSDIVKYFNLIINKHGYPSISVPQSILDASKSIYENKLSNSVTKASVTIQQTTIQH